MIRLGVTIGLLATVDGLASGYLGLAWCGLVLAGFSLWAWDRPARLRVHRVSRDPDFIFPGPDNKTGAAPLTRPTPRPNRR